MKIFNKIDRIDVYCLFSSTAFALFSFVFIAFQSNEHRLLETVVSFIRIECMYILWSRCKSIIGHQPSTFHFFFIKLQCLMFNGPELYVMVITTETNNLLPDYTFFHHYYGPWTVIFFFISTSFLQNCFLFYLFHLFIRQMNSRWFMRFVAKHKKQSEN